MPKKPLKTQTTPKSSTESSTSKANEIAPDSVAGGKSELELMQAELAAGTTEAPKQTVAGGESPTPPAGTGAPIVPKRRKFKSYKPEQTVKMTIRQYWRFRDWMARRALGLPSEYTGVFVQNEEKLVTPLVEPIVGCLDTYLPEEWVVFIEEKSPLIHLLLALFEVEQVFQSQVDQAKAELKKTKNPDTSKPEQPQKPVFPTLSETEGKKTT